MISILQYLNSIEDSYGLTKSLGEICPCRDNTGRVIFSTGNSAVVFKILHHNKPMMLKCYTRQKRGLKEIYGERFLENELYIYEGIEGRWVDVVLDSWIEGETLEDTIAGATKSSDRDKLKELACKFDALSIELLSKEYAHGDIKPDNIIVDNGGELHLIDLDATYLPSMAGELSSELGTKAFQHPARTVETFDDSLDDFPIALISTALHALSIQPALYHKYIARDGLLFDVQNRDKDSAYNEAIKLFEGAGDAVRLQIAKLLLSPTTKLFGLDKLLNINLDNPSANSDEGLELYVERGLWGYCTSDTNRVVIPPLYNCGFEFSDGVAAVQVGSAWHYIDKIGDVIINCTEFDVIKPFKDGVARVRKDGEWRDIKLNCNDIKFDI